MLLCCIKHVKNRADANKKMRFGRFCAVSIRRKNELMPTKITIAWRVMLASERKYA